MRFDYLDAVRAFALIMGIVFHASLSFVPIFIGWAVMDISTSEWVSVFVLLSHSFRMPLFFLIAGFFSHMSFHHNGRDAFVKTRLIRIGLPFLVGWFLLRPLLVSGWVMGAESMRGDVNVQHGFLAALNTLVDIPTGLFVGTHLWFLYYLLIVSTTVVGLRFVISVHKPLKEACQRFADSSIKRMSDSGFAWFVVVIPIAICLWFMQHWGIDTPDKSLIPNGPVSFLYGGFFLLGWLLHRQPLLLDKLTSMSKTKVLVCAFATASVILLSDFEAQQAHSHYSILKVGFVFSYAMLMWTLISLIIGLSQRVFNRPNSIVRYIADASYWLYLIHLPIVIGLQIAFAELPIHWLLKLVAICVITLLVSLLTYDLFVRSTGLGSILNGKQKPSFFTSRLKQRQLGT